MNLWVDLPGSAETKWGNGTINTRTGAKGCFMWRYIMVILPLYYMGGYGECWWAAVPLCRRPFIGKRVKEKENIQIRQFEGGASWASNARAIIAEDEIWQCEKYINFVPKILIKRGVFDCESRLWRHGGDAKWRIQIFVVNRIIKITLNS